VITLKEEFSKLAQLNTFLLLALPIAVDDPFKFLSSLLIWIN